MPLDPNIILGGQQPQIQNPMDAMVKAQNLKSLVMQNQQLQKTTDDQNTMNDILKRNLVIGDSGKPQIDRQSALKEISQINPLKAVELDKTWRAQDADAMETNRKVALTVASSMDPNDANSWAQGKKTAMQLGMPNADKIPDNPDPVFYKNWLSHLYSPEEQAKQMNADRDYNLKKDENSTKHEENAIKRQELSQNKQTEMFKTAVQMKEASRQAPQYKQAQTDLLASNKALMIVDKYKDNLDAIPTTLAPILSTELAKVAGGGVPTESQIREMNPDTFRSTFGRLATKVTGSPQSLGAGDIIKLQVAYLNDLRDNAKNMIQSQNSYLENTLGTKMHPTELSAFKNQNKAELDSLTGKFGNDSGAVPVQKTYKTNEIDWAN